MQLIFKRSVNKNCVMENFSLSFPVVLFYVCFSQGPPAPSLFCTCIFIPTPTHMPRDFSPALESEFIFMNYKLMQKEEARVWVSSSSWQGVKHCGGLGEGSRDLGPLLMFINEPKKEMTNKLMEGGWWHQTIWLIKTAEVLEWLWKAPEDGSSR